MRKRTRSSIDNLLEERVLISPERLKYLEECEAKLGIIESYGVYNWEEWGEVTEDFEEWLELNR